MNLDFKTFGMKGYSYGILSIGAWILNIILAIIGIEVLNIPLGILVLVAAVLAYTNGKKELSYDPSNSKAKIGKRIGLIVIALQILFVLIIIGLTLILVGAIL